MTGVYVGSNIPNFSLRYAELTAPTSDFDYTQTIISQYANSASLVTLIGAASEWIDPTPLFDSFYNLIWNVDSARDIGLDIWGRIVGVQRILHISSADYFGFEEAFLSGQPFNQAPFYTGQITTNNFRLSDESFRTLIYAKALANICDGSTPGINQVLRYLFPGRGNCYVTDNEDMTITYTFNFQLSPVEVAIVEQSGVLPKPTGVFVNYIIASSPTSPTPSPTPTTPGVGVWDSFTWNDGSFWG
jgi:hypothetical protein